MTALMVQMQPVKRNVSNGTVIVWVWQVFVGSGSHLVPSDLIAAGESVDVATAMAAAAPFMVSASAIATQDSNPGLVVDFPGTQQQGTPGA